MRELFKRFKALTGIKFTDIAKELGVTKQAIDYSIDALTARQVYSNKHILNTRIDRAIESHQEEINKLQQLKEDVIKFGRD